MKLPEKVIKALKGNFRYKDVPSDAWKSDTWVFDDDAYYKEKDCWRLHNAEGAWIEVPLYLMEYRGSNSTTQLDKVCKWLENNVSKYTESIGGGVNVTELIYDLKEAMKK